MINKVIFDLDQTIVDTSILEPLRKQRNWSEVYKNLNAVRKYAEIDKIYYHIMKKKYNIGIVTSSPKVYAEKVLNHIGWQVDCIIGYHDIKLKKPHPEPILLALQKMQADPKNVISLGDRDIDIIASKAAGVKTGACLWGAENKKSLLDTKPDYVFNTTKDLLDFILKK